MIIFTNCYNSIKDFIIDCGLQRLTLQGNRQRVNIHSQNFIKIFRNSIRDNNYENINSHEDNKTFFK